ncbi:ADP-forming succinate--CoA ligase subunit beta [Candidatus Woesearchaeota archaeon]|nr:ADP-forming succinate--CoA ligase subunit beta [Candidatus Woesearchaeota archaeon]
MKLLEFEGKQLFKRVGITIPKSILITSKNETKKIKAPCIVKAQVLSGKRGKAGLIKKFTKAKQAQSFAKKLLKRKDVFGVLSEHILPIKKEYYLSLMIDGIVKDVKCMFCARGGMDIEEVAKKYPKEILTFSISEINKIKVPEKKVIANLVMKLYALMKKYDAELVELNPLAVINKWLVAIDSKVVIDSKALYRHPEFQKYEHRELTGRELEAAHAGLHYVDLQGNVGIIGDGAGLVMATMDTLQHYKLKPANFMDVGGGAGEARMLKALQILSKKKLKCIFINIFGGITLCDDIARAIVSAKKKLKLKIPLVVRMAGTNVHDATEILDKAQIHTVPTMLRGIQQVRKLCQS